MLNRRILRIKAFKELFAIEMLPESSLATAQKELDTAIESTRDLYLMMLAVISPLTQVAVDRFAQLALKVNKTPEEQNPNMKFAHNALASLFDTDPDFLKAVKKRNIDWGPYLLILQKIYASIQEKDYFQTYLQKAGTSLKEDCALFIKIFEEEFVGREDVDTALEGLSIYWNDDLPYALTCCCKTLEKLGKGGMWELPELYLSATNKDLADDYAFVHKLLQMAYVNYGAYSQAVFEIVPNWDKDRLVATDMAIIVTALAEIVYFSDIPVKVSINEYVEISKYFGTAKSSTFVNGILDTLSKKDEFKKLN